MYIFGGAKISFYRISFTNPLVYELIDKTDIIPTRKILKELMNKHIIFANEEENNIILAEALIEAFNKIKNENDLNFVDDSFLKYATITRQNFRCYICGENGKQINLAYLTVNKNTMDLNSVIGICPDCYKYHTKDGVIVRAFVLSDVFSMDEKCKSVKFLISHLPEVKGLIWVEAELEKFENQFGEKEVIKALSISLNRNCDINFQSIDAFIKYTGAILRNAFTDGVKVNRNVYNLYDLHKWDI